MLLRWVLQREVLYLGRELHKKDEQIFSCQSLQTENIPEDASNNNETTININEFPITQNTDQFNIKENSAATLSDTSKEQDNTNIQNSNIITDDVSDHLNKSNLPLAEQQ